jgi:hypothetical protein
LAGGYSDKRVQAGGAAKFGDVPDKNGFSHMAESLQYLLMGGGEALWQTPRSCLSALAERSKNASPQPPCPKLA